MNIVAVAKVALTCTLLAASPWTLAGDAVESKPVHFAKGASSATMKCSLKGDKVIDYMLVAKAGQTMQVRLKTSNLSNNFNVLPPGTGQVPCSWGDAGQGSRSVTSVSSVASPAMPRFV